VCLYVVKMCVSMCCEYVCVYTCILCASLCVYCAYLSEILRVDVFLYIDVVSTCVSMYIYYEYPCDK